jgi:hypothetical protein
MMMFSAVNTGLGSPGYEYRGPVRNSARVRNGLKDLGYFEPMTFDKVLNSGFQRCNRAVGSDRE